MVKWPVNLSTWLMQKMKISGREPGKLLRSLFRKIIFLKFWMPNILPRHMCDWKVRMMRVSSWKWEQCCFIDMDLPEKNCAELTQQTADAIDDDSLHQLFVSTQMNNLDLCVKSALQWGSHLRCQLLTLTLFRHVLKATDWTWNDVVVIVFSKFPHFWVCTFVKLNISIGNFEWQ